MATEEEKLEQIKQLCSQPHKAHSLTAIEVLAVIHDQDINEVLKNTPGWLRKIFDVQRGDVK